MYLPLVKPILRIVAFILSIIVYVLTIFAAYGGRFNTEFFTFPAIMTLTLPYLACLTLIITVAWFSFGKILPGSLGVLAILASWGPISTVSPFAGSNKPSPGATTFKVLTYNMIHGWDMQDRDSTANRTIEYIKNSGADIVAVQELLGLNSKEVPNLTDKQKEELLKIYPYFVGDPANDMKVFSKYPVVFEKGYNYIDGDFDQKRYSFFKLNVKGHKLMLINVHLKSFMLSPTECEVLTNFKSLAAMRKSIGTFKGPVRAKLERGFKKRKKDVEILRKTLDRMKGATLVIGDFNDVPESYAYRLLKGDDFKDAYVETGFGPMVTYNRHAFWFHLDQIFYRGPLRALSVKKGNVKFSDHYPLLAEFEFIPDDD